MTSQYQEQRLLWLAVKLEFYYTTLRDERDVTSFIMAGKKSLSALFLNELILSSTIRIKSIFRPLYLHLFMKDHTMQLDFKLMCQWHKMNVPDILINVCMYVFLPVVKGVILHCRMRA